MIRLVAEQEVLVTRWHKDVNRAHKRLWLSFKDVLKRGDRKEAVLPGCHYAFLFTCLPLQVAIGSVFVGGFLVGSLVSATHQSEEIMVQGDQPDYVTGQFRSTRDADTVFGPLETWLWGGMDTQLAHHLFPSMPRYNYHRPLPSSLRPSAASAEAEAERARARARAAGDLEASAEPADEAEGGLECVICYTPIDAAALGNVGAGRARGRGAPANDYMLTPCDHIFHEHCLQRWMEQKLECPVCRTTLPPE